MCFLFLFCIIKIKCLFFTFIFLFIWMQVLFFLIFYSLFCFFIFVIFYKKIIITVFPFPCFICPAPAPGAGIVNFCCRGKELVNCHLEGCRIGLTTTTRTWLWNISGQVRLISGPRFCHLGGCRIGLAETDNGSEWTGSDRLTDRPSELIYRIPPEEGTGGSCTTNEDLKALGKVHNGRHEICEGNCTMDAMKFVHTRKALRELWDE